MFLRNFLLFSQVVKKSSWRSFGLRRIHKRRFNKSLSYFKSDDVEQGLKQQYIQNKQYNNNENEVRNSNNNKLVDSGQPKNAQRSVYLRRGLKAVGSLVAISFAAFITFYMDNLIYGLISIAIAIVSILFITGNWRWFYIAFVTAPRDTKWVQ